MNSCFSTSPAGAADAPPLLAAGDGLAARGRRRAAGVACCTRRAPRCRRAGRPPRGSSAGAPSCPPRGAGSRPGFPPCLLLQVLWGAGRIRRAECDRQATRIRFAESSHRTTTGSPGPSPETAAAPAAFWRRATTSPATSVVIRNSVWSPRYVPWWIRPSISRPAGPLRIGAPGRVDAHALGSHGDLHLRAGGRPGVGIRHHPCQAESRVRFHDAASGRRVVLHEPAVDRVGDADEVGDEAVDRALVELRRPALLLDPAVAA